MVPSSFKNYSEILDLFISRERNLSHKIKETDIIKKKLGISLKMYDRLMRGYAPEFKGKSVIALRLYFEFHYQHTFIYQKGIILTKELPPLPKTEREKRMETRITNMTKKLRVLEVENNYLRNRLKETS